MTGDVQQKKDNVNTNTEIKVEPNTELKSEDTKKNVEMTNERKSEYNKTKTASNTGIKSEDTEKNVEMTNVRKSEFNKTKTASSAGIKSEDTKKNVESTNERKSEYNKTKTASNTGIKSEDTKKNIETTNERKSEYIKKKMESNTDMKSEDTKTRKESITGRKSEYTKKEEEKPTRKSVALGHENITSVQPSELSMANKAQETSRLRMRKQSIGMSSVMSIRRNEMASSMGLEYKRPFIIYEPTYQLDPIIRFDCHQVTKYVNEILDTTYEDHRYNVEATPALAVNLANTLMREVKHMMFNRYRVLSIVVIGQKRAQGYTNTISFIWDPIRDAYIDLHRENISTFIQVTIVGIYLD